MYELSNDTLGHSSNIPCDMDMNRKYDDCISSEFHARLYDKFGCTVPFLPSNESLQICSKNGQEVLNYYDMLSTSGTGSLCSTPCATMQVSADSPCTMRRKNNPCYAKNSAVRGMGKSMWERGIYWCIMRIFLNQNQNPTGVGPC